MKKRLWMFDLDGTLADTDGDIRASWKAALADLGLSCPRFDEDFVAGPPIEEMARILFPDIYTDSLALAIRELFGRHYDTDGFPNTFEYPGVLDAVRTLKARGESVVIATNKRFAGAKAMAEKFGWMEVFDALYAGDMHKDDPIGKLRKPALLRLILKERNISPEECVMVGDTANDFDAAAENSILPVGVAWGYGKPDELAKAAILVHEAKEIPAIGF